MSGWVLSGLCTKAPGPTPQGLEPWADIASHPSRARSNFVLYKVGDCSNHRNKYNTLHVKGELQLSVQNLPSFIAGSYEIFANETTAKEVFEANGVRA